MSEIVCLPIPGRFMGGTNLYACLAVRKAVRVEVFVAYGGKGWASGSGQGLQEFGDGQWRRFGCGGLFLEGLEYEFGGEF